MNAAGGGLPPESGKLFALGTATVTTVGYEHGTLVVIWLNGGPIPH